MTSRTGPIARLSWLLVLVAVMALVVRVAAIDRQGLWVDEVFSLAMATGHSLEHPPAIADPAWGDFAEHDEPLSAEAFRRYAQHETPPAGLQRVVRAVRLSDTSPPLYYALLNVWLRFAGSTDTALRAFSLMWGIACLPLLFAVARHVGGSSAALTACVLFALAPVAVRYSIEGRMYSLLWFLVLATAWLALRIQARGARMPALVLLVLLSAAGLLTHYFYLFAWLAICSWLVWQPGRLDRRLLVAAMGLAGLIVLPWYLAAVQAMGDWRVTQGWLEARPSRYGPATAPLELAMNFFSNSPGERAPLPALRWVALAALGAAPVAWWLGRWMVTGSRAMLWLWVGAACVGPLLFDLALGTYASAVPRYALAGFPAALLIVATGLSRLPTRGHAAVLAIGLVAWAPGLWRIYAEEARGTSPIREVARELDARSDAADLIVVHSIPSGVVGLARYLHAPTPIVSRIGQLRRPVLPDQLEMLLTRRRVFVVKIRAGGGVAPQEEYLRKETMLVREMRVRNSAVLEFAPRELAAGTRTLRADNQPHTPGSHERDE